MKYITHISLVLILVFSMIEILPMPIEFELITEVSASTTWTETNWSLETNYTEKHQLRIDPITGDVKLLYGPWIFVDDTYNYRLVHTMLTGVGWNTYGTWGSGTGNFWGSFGIYYDVSSNYLYVADAWNYRIIKTQMGGTGWTAYGSSGTGTGQFNRPYDIHYDASTGDIYIADSYNNRIIRTKINGNGWTTFGTQGNKTGQFNNPTGIYYDNNTGYIYVADQLNHRIVRTFIDGSGWEEFGSSGGGPGQFNYPTKLCYDPNSDYVYVVDSLNHRIVKTMMNGTGWETYGSYGTGTSKGQFNYPYGIWLDDQPEYIYVADTGNNRIVRTNMNGSYWYTFNGGSSGQFYQPSDIITAGRSYISDGYLVSREIDLSGPMSLLTINWTADVPANTALKFQIKTAPNQSALDNANYVGPNGSANRYYTTSGENIWSGHEGDRWVQYKVFLSTNAPQSSPELKDITLVYNLLPNSPILLAPENDNWTNDNTTIFLWEHRDSDSTSQMAFQWQMDNNMDFKSIEFDSNTIASSKNSYTHNKILSDGIWYWRVRTMDSDGGWGPFSTERKINIDTKPSNSFITWPKENGFYKKVELITGTTSDPEIGSGVNKTEISIQRLSDDNYWDGSNWQNVEIWLSTIGYGNWMFNASSILWSSGVSYKVQTRSMDNVTNSEIPKDALIFNIDTEAPVSIVEFPIDGQPYNELKTITGSSYDIGGVGVKLVELCIQEKGKTKFWNGKNWGVSEIWMSAIGTTEWSFDTKAVLWDTGMTYIITSRAVDIINNEEEFTNNISFIFDIDRPHAEVVFPAVNSFLNKVDQIEGTAFDIGGAGIDFVEITIKRKTDNHYWNGVDWDTNIKWLITEGTNNWYIDSSKVQWSSDLFYAISTRVTDNASNYMTFEPGISFMFDNKPPTQYFIINDDSEYTNNTNVKLTIESLDTGSGIDTMSISADGISWSNWTQMKSIEYYDLPVGDGEKTVYLKLKDKAGNTAQYTTETIILDTVPPVNTIVINNDAKFTKSKSVILNVSASDTLSGIDKTSLSIDSSSWSYWEPFTSSMPFNLFGVDSEKWVYYQVRDKAGNTAIAQDSIILDSTPPTNLKIIINDGADNTKDRTLTLKLEAQDDSSGLDKMSFCTLDQSWQDWEPYSETLTFELSDKPGQQIVYFRVSDKAGNVASPVSATIILNIEDGSGGDGDKGNKDTELGFDIFAPFNILLIVIIIIIFIVLLAVVMKRNKKRRDEALAKAESDSARTSTLTTKVADQASTVGSSIPSKTSGQALQPVTSTGATPLVRGQTTAPQLPPAQTTEITETTATPQATSQLTSQTILEKPEKLTFIDSIMRDGVAVPITAVGAGPQEYRHGQMQSHVQTQTTSTKLQSATPISQYKPAVSPKPSIPTETTQITPQQKPIQSSQNVQEVQNVQNIQTTESPQVQEGEIKKDNIDTTNNNDINNTKTSQTFQAPGLTPQQQEKKDKINQKPSE